MDDFHRPTSAPKATRRATTIAVRPACGSLRVAALAKGAAPAPCSRPGTRQLSPPTSTRPAEPGPRRRLSPPGGTGAAQRSRYYSPPPGATLHVATSAARLLLPPARGRWQRHKLGLALPAPRYSPWAERSLKLAGFRRAQVPPSQAWRCLHSAPFPVLSVRSRARSSLRPDLVAHLNAGLRPCVRRRRLGLSFLHSAPALGRAESWRAWSPQAP